MSEEVRITRVDATNVDREGFFCFKSKPRTPGYQRKLAWLRDRFVEGMTLDILYEGKRSFAFCEAIPGEFAWRAINAPDYMVIHCIWTVGSGKKKGFASRLLERCEEEAARQGKSGVVILSSDEPFLADKKFFLNKGFAQVDAAAGFELLAKKHRQAPDPTIAHDWESRASAFGKGLTVIRTDQCPYWDDATNIAIDTAERFGIPARTVELHTADEVRTLSPTPYGTLAFVLDGRPVSHYYRLPRELQAIFNQSE